MPLVFGVAQCSHCGAKTGTLFDETAHVELPDRWKGLRNLPKKMDEQTRVEKAQDRANNSLILGLTSFFPLIGLGLGLGAILCGVFSMKALREMNIEEGRGSATAGLVIGGLGLVAQGCLIAYVLNLMSIVRP